MQNIVINVCEKFHNDWLINNRSSGNGKSDNNKKNIRRIGADLEMTVGARFLSPSLSFLQPVFVFPPSLIPPTLPSLPSVPLPPFLCPMLSVPSPSLLLTLTPKIQQGGIGAL